jgi:acyl-CoA thioesterase FadM
MDHVNNAVYLDWLEEAILAENGGDRTDLAAVPRRYRLEYAAAADPGAVLEDAAWGEGDGRWSYRLAGIAGSDVFRATLEIGGDR